MIPDTDDRSLSSPQNRFSHLRSDPIRTSDNNTPKKSIFRSNCNRSIVRGAKISRQKRHLHRSTALRFLSRPLRPVLRRHPLGSLFQYPPDHCQSPPLQNQSAHIYNSVHTVDLLAPSKWFPLRCEEQDIAENIPELFEEETDEKRSESGDTSENTIDLRLETAFTNTIRFFFETNDSTAIIRGSLGCASCG